MFLIRCYQVAVSPYLGRWCRFTPSCSAYGYRAIEQHGVVRGGWLTLCRLLRCHPFCRGGHDPVPNDEFRTSDSGLRISICRPTFRDVGVNGGRLAAKEHGKAQIYTVKTTA